MPEHINKLTKFSDDEIILVWANLGKFLQCFAYATSLGTVYYEKQRYLSIV